MSVSIRKFEPKATDQETPSITTEGTGGEKNKRPPLSSLRVDHTSTVGLSWEQIEALRPPIIIDGFLRQGEVMLIGAESKSRKSWLAQDAGLAVALGQSWLTDPEGNGGFDTKRADVHVFDLELAESEMLFRFAKARGNRLAGDTKTQTEVSEKFYSYTLESEGAHEILAYLQELADEVKPGDLVIVDCLYRIQADGNETELIASALEALKKFASRTRAGVILVDHFRKAGADKARDRFAGTFIKQASASTLVAIEVKSEGVLELNIDARTFHGMNRTFAAFDLETYAFRQVPEEDVQAERDAKGQAQIEGWLAEVWRSKSLDFCATNRDGESKWHISRQAAGTRFLKLESAELVEIAEGGAGKAKKWRLSEKGQAILAVNLGLHPHLHPDQKPK